MDLHVRPTDEGWLLEGDAGRWYCAVGRGGLRRDKHEGDGTTPIGCWPLRRVLYRADRVAKPETRLPMAPLAPDAGWCDDPRDGLYNHQIKLPYPAHHERLWREDALYDIIVVLGYNDSPPIPDAGSAIFLHIAAEGYSPTEGCVALAKDHLRRLLELIEPGDRLCVDAPEPD